MGPCLLPQPASLLCFPPPVPCAARPPRWDAPGQIQLRLRFTWRLHELLDPPPYALEPPLSRHATPPRTSSRLPPRRRRGPARTEPAAPFSRAHQNQGALLDLFPSLSRSFPAQTPQTATAALPNAGEPQAAIEPHLHSRSAQINPASSSALAPRSSPTSPLRPIRTGSPRRRSPRTAAALLAVDPSV